MTLQCPYHAWTYGLNGCLRARAAQRARAGFDPDDYGLLPVGVEKWGPLCSSTATWTRRRSRTTWAGCRRSWPTPASTSAALRYHDRSEWELAANWKAVVENYLECYHCPTAHPDFSKVIDVDPDAYNLTSDEWFSSQISHTREGAERRELPVQPGRRDRRGALPLAVADVHDQRLPRPAEPRRARFLPVGARRTTDRHRPFYGEDVTEDEIASIQEFGSQVGRRGPGLVESIQRAADSGGLTEGRLMLSSEHLIQHFQRLVERALA